MRDIQGINLPEDVLFQYESTAVKLSKNGIINILCHSNTIQRKAKAIV